MRFHYTLRANGTCNYPVTHQKCRAMVKKNDDSMGKNIIKPNTEF